MPWLPVPIRRESKYPRSCAVLDTNGGRRNPQVRLGGDSLSQASLVNVAPLGVDIDFLRSTPASWRRARLNESGLNPSPVITGTRPRFVFCHFTTHTILLLVQHLNSDLKFELGSARNSKVSEISSGGPVGRIFSEKNGRRTTLPPAIQTLSVGRCCIPYDADLCVLSRHSDARFGPSDTKSHSRVS
jgi:hypothetical protein